MHTTMKVKNTQNETQISIHFTSTTTNLSLLLQYNKTTCFEGARIRLRQVNGDKCKPHITLTAQKL
jgi:hypothetical protein